MKLFAQQEMPLWCGCGHELILIPQRPQFHLTFTVLDRQTMEVLETCPHCFLAYRIDIQCSLKSLQDTPPNFRGQLKI